MNRLTGGKPPIATAGDAVPGAGKERLGHATDVDASRLIDQRIRDLGRGASETGPAASETGSGASGTRARRGRTGPVPRRGSDSVVLLSGGNPQIAKADGDVPVQAYIAAMPGWKRGLGQRLDALIVRHVPDVRKAVKWNSPFYGIDGQGWFLSFHVFARYVKVTFFNGTSLRPVPPGGTVRSKDARWIDIHEGDELDEPQMATWVKQAAAMPGWDPGRSA
jgi:hypothetical protein